MANTHSILAAVSQSSASMEAVLVACRMAKQRKAKVVVLNVIEVLRSLPLNAEMDVEARKGEQLLRRAEQAASEFGIQVMTALVQAREAGPAIVEEASDRQVDAIVLGLGYKRVVGSFAIGRTADYVLKHANARVLLVRPSLQGEHAGPEQHGG